MIKYDPYPLLDLKIYCDQVEKLERKEAIPAMCEAIERFFLGYEHDVFGWIHPEVNYRQKMTWNFYHHLSYQRHKAEGKR